MRTHLLGLLLVGTLLIPAGCGPLQANSPAPNTAIPIAAPAVSTMAPDITPADTPLVSPTTVPMAGTPVPVVTSTNVPEPAAVATVAPAGSGDADGAVQAVLDYWAAVNEHAYARAYGCWAGGGAASGQTYDQFADGFADTVQVTVQIGALPDGNSVEAATIPVTLTAVANVHNDPAQNQRIDCYRGVYTLRRSGESWHIAGADVARVQNPVLPPVDVAEAGTVLQSYFDAINRREFARAYTCWAELGQASQQTYAQFHQGFGTTARVAFRLGPPRTGAAAGSSYAEVPAVIVATQSDGAIHTYAGTYTLRRANIPPFGQFGWRIERASMARVADLQLDSPEAERLLSATPTAVP